MRGALIGLLTAAMAVTGCFASGASGGVALPERLADDQRVEVGPSILERAEGSYLFDGDPQTRPGLFVKISRKRPSYLPGDGWNVQYEKLRCDSGYWLDLQDFRVGFCLQGDGTLNFDCQDGADCGFCNYGQAGSGWSCPLGGEGSLTKHNKQHRLVINVWRGDNSQFVTYGFILWQKN